MLHDTEHAFTFDDLLLVPSASSVLPSDVDLATHLTSTVALNIPLVIPQRGHDGSRFNPYYEIRC